MILFGFLKKKKKEDKKLAFGPSESPPELEIESSNEQFPFHPEQVGLPQQKSYTETEPKQRDETPVKATLSEEDILWLKDWSKKLPHSKSVGWTKEQKHVTPWEDFEQSYKENVATKPMYKCSHCGAVSENKEFCGNCKQSKN